MPAPLSPTASLDRLTAPERRGVAQALREIEAALGEGGGGRAVEVYGAGGSLGAALSARLASGAAPVVYVCADEDAAEARLDDLSFFLPAPAASEDPLSPPAALQLPAPDPSPYAEMQPDRRALLGRMAALFRLARGFAPRVLVASAPALFRRVVPRAPFDALCWTIRAGATIDRDETIDALARAGFSRASVVEDPGTFAVRGAVIDVFPPVYKHPVRVELFGDEVEGLRLYDAATQRTLRPLPELHLHPVRDTIRTAGADPRAKVLAAADAAVFPSSKTRHILEQIEEGELFFGMEALAPAFHARMETVFDYLPRDALLVVEDPEAVVEAARRQATRLRETAQSRRAEHRLALDAHEFVLLEDEARAALAARRRLELRPVEVVHVGPEGSAPPRVRLAAEPNTGLRAELQRARAEQSGERLHGAHPDAAAIDVGRPLRHKLRAWMADGQRVRLVAPNRAHADRLAGLLAAWGLEAQGVVAARGHAAHAPHTSDDLFDAARAPAPLAVLSGPLTRGFRLPADRLVLVSEEEIFGPRAHREARAPAKAAAGPGLGDLGEIAEGDAVVHDEHGIGRYRGLKKLTVRGVPQDFLHLEYDGGSIYVPVYRIGLCHRYSGGEVDAVRLDKLGGNTWKEKRRRVSAEARKVAEELLQLYAQRAALEGHAFPAPDATFHEFEETFPFEETPDQARAIETVLADMQNGVPMDRLVCGDVGYGKTEVALRATLLAVLGGKQVAVLAPTTVLAEQHLMTFGERFADFPVRVAGLSRFRAKSEQAKTVGALAAGQLDVVVGTHRILSRDVRFRDLGLVVIDEEQRFGVAHKERLKELRTQVDVLTLTATPIPRTLQMSMGGLREISVIATPPADRLAIRTFVCRFDPALLGDALAKELQRGGQIFYVHNRVEDIHKEAEKVRALADAYHPGTRVAIGHGQMPEGELEKVMVDFVDGKHDVLVCTTIIESGLDIPRANTMIVNRADRFGLAQLYQLRGRIGRSRERAFCYLVVPDEGRMTPEAKARLAVLQRFTELGAGFAVATHDLEIRGAGELLGERQHGAVAAVGFETYAKILEEAVAELKGEPIRRELDPEITVDVPAFLPDDYLPDTGQRLDFYRRLAQARDEDDVRAVVEELEDRYGPLPDEARLLAEVMVDKTLVRTLGAQGYELSAARIVLTLGETTRLAPAKVLKLVQSKGSRWKLSPDMRLAYSFTETEKAERLPAARARLTELGKLVD
jgi:transcription-repair coupling factor (superfamily II helicase)